MKDKYHELVQFGKNLLNTESLNDGMLYISLNAKSLTGAERCSIFIYDINEDELWTILADESEKIVVPYDLGIVGQTMIMPIFYLMWIFKQDTTLVIY